MTTADYIQLGLLFGTFSKYYPEFHAWINTLITIKTELNNGKIKFNIRPSIT